jgi:hypothetical protein
MRHVLDGKVECPVEPRHIDTSGTFSGALGHSLTEISAKQLVQFAQEYGSWKPFTQKELQDFLQEKFGYRTFVFHQLLSHGWIHQRTDTNKFHFTLELVARVWGTSPRV